jgi:hypothetical protein
MATTESGYQCSDTHERGFIVAQANSAGLDKAITSAIDSGDPNALGHLNIN